MDARPPASHALALALLLACAGARPALAQAAVQRPLPAGGTSSSGPAGKAPSRQEPVPAAERDAPAAPAQPEDDAPAPAGTAGNAGPQTPAAADVPRVGADVPVTTGRAHPVLAPLAIPLSLVVPGTSHLLRGEKRTGYRLLAGGGLSLGGLLLAGGALALTGAADVPASGLIPLALVFGSTHLALGTADVLGGFFAGPGEGPPTLAADAQGEGHRVHLTYLLSPNPRMDQAHFLTLGFDRRAGRWGMGVEAGAHAGGPFDGWLGARGGARLLQLGEASHAALWAWGDARWERFPDGGWDTVRVRMLVEAAVPMGVLGPTLRDVTAVVRVGVAPSVTRFDVNGTWLWRVYPVGGFETRWAPWEPLRLVVGYEHARDGLLAATNNGFTGQAYAGLEVRVGPGVWMHGRAVAGSPAAGQFTLERRW